MVGLRHLVELFQYSVTLVQDLLTGELKDDDPNDYPKYLAADWDIYIGNDPEWYNNPKCNEEPLLSNNY